jgi:AcrR family transcriptional regulator
MAIALDCTPALDSCSRRSVDSQAPSTQRNRSVLDPGDRQHYITDRLVINMPSTLSHPPVATAASLQSHQTPRAPKQQRQRRKEARPQELLAAALSLFVEKGFAATRMDEVAQRAGVSKGTLYLYYPGKEDLFKAVVRQNLSSLIEEGQQAADSFEGSSTELLVFLMQTWWERVGNTELAGIHKVVLSEVRNFPELAQFYTDEVIVPADRLFSSAVQRGINRGEFRPLPLHEVAHALIAPLIFMALHRHSFGCCPVRGGVDVDPTLMLQTHLDLVLRGLEVRTHSHQAKTPRARHSVAQKKPSQVKPNP